MSDLSILVKDTFPANEQTGVPLQSEITMTLSGLDYNTSSLTDGMFIEGPDTDQFVGPGQIDQVVPNNISQGDLDDFLQSPGYAGIVAGAITTSGIAGDTVVTFTPTLPMAPLTDYVVNLTGVEDVAEDSIDGFVTFGFTTGSGSIEELPSDISSSVLSAVIAEASSDPDVAFAVTTTTPADNSIKNSTETSEVVVEFNKAIDPTSVAGNVTVETVPATDHPNAATSSQGDLAVSTEVSGNRLTIKI